VGPRLTPEGDSAAPGTGSPLWGGDDRPGASTVSRVICSWQILAEDSSGDARRGASSWQQEHGSTDDADPVPL